RDRARPLRHQHQQQRYYGGGARDRSRDRSHGGAYGRDRVWPPSSMSSYSRNGGGAGGDLSRYRRDRERSRDRDRGPRDFYSRRGRRGSLEDRGREDGSGGRRDRDKPSAGRGGDGGGQGKEGRGAAVDSAATPAKSGSGDKQEAKTTAAASAKAIAVPGSVITVVSDSAKGDDTAQKANLPDLRMVIERSRRRGKMKPSRGQEEGGGEGPVAVRGRMAGAPGVMRGFSSSGEEGEQEGKRVG
ncbi:unnamed protein product, partial [Ectocarpus sp. 13 AM-2016]